MAFLHTSSAAEEAQHQRFSLLLLEHGEVYFEDFSVTFFPPGMKEADALHRDIRGRLKVCSHSIIFDPQDLSLPIMKFPFRKCKGLDRWSPPLLSRISGEVLSIKTASYIELREDNLIKPYTFFNHDLPMEFRFSPHYNPLSSLLGMSSKLFKAWQLHPAERADAIARIATEHQSHIEFESCWIEDLSEKIVLKTTASHVTPLVSNPGRLVLTSKRLYFQSFNNVFSEPVRKYRISAVRRVVKRRHLQRAVGLELFLDSDKRLFVSFDRPADRDAFHDALLEQSDLDLEASDQINMMLSWQNGALSNYDYLMYLNSMADRSFNDLTQYPVFPWVIADYTSDHLDLENPATFRDLSKPVGALNPSRLEAFQKRFKEMPPPKFLYGTHYSTPGFVLYYTLRLAPEFALCLQNGRFDHADRMFLSIAQTWENVNQDSADVKELIPEFYQPEGFGMHPAGAFLVNAQAVDFGTTQDNRKVGDVELPKWAADAGDFVRKCREALECEYVSQRLHHWIDLIFGFKQRGPEAVKADNVFYYLTYEGALDLEKITDRHEREAIEAQITEFGQTPKQLFTIPHPQRRALAIARPLGISTGASVLGSPMVSRAHRADSGAGRAGAADGAASSAALLDYGYSDSSAPSAGAAADESPPAAAAAAEAAEAVSAAGPGGWSAMIHLEFEDKRKIHRDTITDLCLSPGGGLLYSVSQDGCLKVHDLHDLHQTLSVSVSNMALSSCCLTPDEKTVIIGSWDNQIYVYSCEFGRTIDTWMAHDDAVSSMVLTGETLVSSSWDSTVKVWDVSDSLAGQAHKRFDDQHCKHEFVSHEGEVSRVAVHHDKQIVASGGMGGKIVVWNLSDYSTLIEFDGHLDLVHAVAISPDGRRLASASSDGTLKVFDMELGAEVFSVDVGDELLVLRFDGQLVIAGGMSGELYLWDVVTGEKVKSFKHHDGPIRCLAVSQDGRKIITGGDDKHIVIWSVPKSA